MAPLPKRVHVGAHHPRQHLLGDARKRRDARPCLVRSLSSCGVGERLHGGRQDHVRAQHGRGERRRRLLPVRASLVHHRENSLGAGGGSLGAHSLPDLLRRRVADDEHVLGLPHPQAVVDDGTDGAFELGHRMHRINPRCAACFSLPRQLPTLVSRRVSGSNGRPATATIDRPAGVAQSVRAAES